MTKNNTSTRSLIRAAVLVHILNRLIFPPEDRTMTLLEIIQEARETVVQLFKGDAHLPELVWISGKRTSNFPTSFWRSRMTCVTAAR